MQKIWLWLLAATMICLVLVGYCNHQATQTADLKTGIGNIEAALNWEHYSSRLVTLGFIFGLIAGCSQPYFKRWEKGALIICFICAYGILAVLMDLLI